MDIKGLILEALTSIEHDKSVDELCVCGKGARQYRCVDCGRLDVFCKDCLIAQHASCPFHWAEEWTGLYFKRVDMSELGLILHLGHRGKVCPSTTEQGSRLRVIDDNGIHDCRVVYCACIDREEHVVQLLKNSLFPGSTKKPDTAFTLRVLRDFHMLATVAKTSAYDYVEALRKKTNNKVPQQVKVSTLALEWSRPFNICNKDPSQLFRRISWFWRFLTAYRRSGQAFQIDDEKLCRPKGSLAVQCLACPLPGFNTDYELDDQ